MAGSAVLIDAALAFSLTLQGANRGQEAVKIGSWPEVVWARGRRSLWTSWQQGDRPMPLTAGITRRMGRLKRALVETVRGLLVWGWGNRGNPT